MSELKAIRSGEIYNIIEYEDCYRTDDLYYPKSEADKVIANRDYEIEKLKESISNLLKMKAEQVMDEVMEKALIYGEGFVSVEQVMKLVAELRHQKYKRCLAMHDYCLCELEFSFRDPCIERSTEGCVRWRKWANLWLELAAKFKEAK